MTEHEKENIDTASMESELMLSILSNLTESELASISQKSKWGVKNRFKHGTFIIFYPPYGYANVDGEMVVVPKKEVVVNRFFVYNSSTSAVLFSCLLIAASVWDVKKRIIPAPLCLLMALVGLICFSPAKLLAILSAMTLFIAVMCKEGSVGGGDIKLTATSGIVTGFPVGILDLIISITAGLNVFL